jgi:hypothetical protein
MIQLERLTRRRVPSLVPLAIALLAIGTLTLGMLSSGCGRTAGSGRTASHQKQQYHCPCTRPTSPTGRETARSAA